MWGTIGQMWGTIGQMWGTAGTRGGLTAVLPSCHATRARALPSLRTLAFHHLSCYHRLAHFDHEALRDLFLVCLERMRCVHRFCVYGYVVMPEHVHLLISEPEVDLVSTAMQALKVAVARRAIGVYGDGMSPFWQKRYYDHNVRNYDSFVQKLRYIHRNPVKRGLCDRPENWKWSSFRHYDSAEIGIVEIESEWTAKRREGKEVHMLGQGST